MESAEIARRFLAFFKHQAHECVRAGPLITDTPTVWFVIAGTHPFKPFLLGQRTPPFRRVADVQKCVRTLDIEEVGKTTRHATFFQMLGNWSFGDYFKEGAITYAWELLTKSEADGGFRFPESKLWATVLHGDDEAYAIWRDEVGLPESRIQRRGLADNYWHMGVPGPGGPCSEIYYDRGPEWAWSGWRPSCRASTTSTRSTPPGRSWTGRRSSPSRTTAGITGPTWPCGGSRITCA